MVILRVLLDAPLLLTGDDVAEVRIDQIVRAHHRETGVDDALLALSTAALMLS